MEWKDRYERTCESKDYWVGKWMDRSACHGWLWTETERYKELTLMLYIPNQCFHCLLLLSNHKDVVGKKRSG